MKHNKSLSSKAVALALASCAFSLSHAPAFAEEAAEIEKIQVTGSRILREGAIAPSSVTSISGEDLVNIGAINIGEALNKLPQLASTYSLSNSGRFIGTSGLNILDLRNMGADRTLVLVDGKRHVSSAAGSQSVDTNTIPTAWVDRVEIITGGASAVYGADAVTGVVNFILKRDIEGLDVSATKGYADNHDFANEKYNFSFGTEVLDGRGNVAVSAEYVSQEALDATDNPWTSTPSRNMTNFDQAAGEENNSMYPDKIYTDNAAYYGINDSGVFSLNPEWWTDLTNTFNPDGTLREIYTGDNVDGLVCSDCDSFNLGEYEQIQPEFDRWNVAVKGNYEITDDMYFYSDAKYVKSTSREIGQPAFFFYDPQNAIQRDNAFLNAAIGQKMDEAGITSIVVNRMMGDLGRRIEDNTRETFRVVVGVEGTVLEDWDYDISAVHGVTDIERVNGNNMIMANYFNAIDAVEDAEGNIVCRDADAQAAGCVPLNIMQKGSASQETIDYINTVSTSTSEITQSVVTASISTPYLYELPAGDVGVAGGVEYRREESNTEEADNAEGTFFNVLGEDNGSFNVNELFAEVTVPVVTDEFWAQDLVVDAAVRYANYSTIGNAISWKVGVDWALNDELRFRATQSEAIRAPNISEIYGAPSQTFYTVDDPCKSSELDLLENGDTRRANCAALGIDPSFDSDYDSATLEGLQSGNSNVEEEKSESTTIGMVYSPSFIANATVTVDYWNIKLDDAIDSISAQDILDRCVDSESGINNQYCDLISRNDDGEITLIQNPVLNVAGQEASGVDFEFSHDINVFDGTLRSNLIGTYLIERKEMPFQQNPSDYYEYAGTTGQAKWQANLNVGFERDNWTVDYSLRFLDGVDLYTEQELEDNPNPSDLMSYPSYAVSDIRFGYELDNGVSFTLGIDNLFNKELPRGTYGNGASSASYDNIGRFAHATVSFKM